MNPLNLEHLKKQAKDLLKAWKSGDSSAADRLTGPQTLANVQWHLAKEHGSPTWAALKARIEIEGLISKQASELLEPWVVYCLGHEFTRPQRDRARQVLTAVPDLALVSPAHAALAGRASLVEEAVTRDPSLLQKTFLIVDAQLLSIAAASIGPDEQVVPMMKRLIELGADPNQSHAIPNHPDWVLRPLYWAAGVAGSLERVKALLDAGADPNDNECLYHCMEGHDPAIMEALVHGGAKWERTNALARLLDYEDLDRLKLALSLGAPVEEPGFHGSALHHAILRNRSLPVLKALVEAGADLSRMNNHGITPVALAGRLGRRDFLDWLAAEGHKVALQGRDAFLAACACGDTERARTMPEADPAQLPQVIADHKGMVADLAAQGRTEGVAALLDMGWPINVRGSGFGSPANEAAFNGDDRTLALLMSRGAHWTEPNTYGGDVWGSIYWASYNVGSEVKPGRHVECARVLLEAGSPVPDLIRGSDEVKDFLETWLEERPDYPRAELS